MEKIFVNAAKAAGATVISSDFHRFDPQGVSGVVVISESHFAVHAWPEYGYAAVDLFTCGENIDFDTAVEEIKNGMQSKSWIVSSLVSRGILNGSGVERIRPIREDDDCHAFQLSWKSRFNDTNGRAFSNSIDLYGCELPGSEEIRQAVECYCTGLEEIIGSPASGVLDVEISEDSLDFFRRYRKGSLSGNIKLDGSIACIDIRVEGFFDPHAASELAMSCFKSQYYRMQPNVRQ
jgi:S-adenosylmethionine decarboxylase